MAELAQIDEAFITTHTDYAALIERLRTAFAQQKIETPLRHHHQFANPAAGIDSTLLLMPSWQAGKELGVKIITVSPENGRHELPAVQGAYLYFEATTGRLQALIEAKSLTVKRTAAASALAASYLARPEARSLLMIGTGALAPELIRAHATVRPIEEVLVWGRSPEKAKQLCQQFSRAPFSCTPVAELAKHLGQADIISCATLSTTPLVLGEYLRAGQHLDLVGSYLPDSRESDDACIEKSRIFLDTYEGGLKESGDIVIPLKQGLLRPADIQADLFELTSGQKSGRLTEGEITLFKSVGHALEDLVAASYYYQKFQNT
ncbi:MAG: ornithine cyclodeaminase family protein [Bacteroidota bacterium]